MANRQIGLYELHDDEYWEANARQLYYKNCEEASHSNANIRFSNLKGRPFHSLLECIRRRRWAPLPDFNPDTPNLHLMEPNPPVTDYFMDDFIEESWETLTQDDFYWVAILKTQFWLVNGRNRGWTLAERSSTEAGQRLVDKLARLIPELEQYMHANFYIAKPWLIPDEDFSVIARTQHFRESVAWAVSFKIELTKHTFKRIRMGRTLSETPRTQFPGDDVIRISMRDAESRLNRLI